MKEYRIGSDLAFVSGEIESMENGGVREFCDFDSLPLHSFRMCIAKIAKDRGCMYQTRYDKEKRVLVIKRIA